MLMRQVSIEIRKTVKHQHPALRIGLAVLLLLLALSALGLGYTQILEFLLAGIFHGAGWTNWLFTNLHFSASFLLNTIGNRVTKILTSILAPAPSLATSTVYTLMLLILAIWFYRRQDVGG